MTGHEDNMRNAAVFAESVRREMRELPAEQVADLTDGLEADMVASLADGGSLPDAVVYARDLMRAAGIEIPSDRRSGRDLVDGIVRFFRHLTRPFDDLQPAWWVIRAWVLMQSVGWLVSNRDSRHTFVSQWGISEMTGVILFLGLLVLSVRVGRHASGVRRQVEVIVSVLLAIPFVSLVLAESHVSPDEYRPGINYPIGGGSTTDENGCVATVPAVVGSTVSVAIEILQGNEFGYRIVDPTGYDITNSEGTRNLPVTSQEPQSTELSCGTTITLSVDPSVNRESTSLPGQSAVQTTTTVPPAMTTVPKSATTAVKATTTTAP